jgi:hypothetical protein
MKQMDKSDFVKATKDVKARCDRIIGALRPIVEQHEEAFEDPRPVFIEPILIIDEIEKVTSVVRKTWWPPK